jgi:transposase
VETPEVTKKSKARKPIDLNFSRIDVVHDLTDDQKICGCGCTLTAFGADITEQLQMVPAYIQVLRHKRLKYACKSCKDGVKIAPVCSQAISKTLAAPGLLAHVAVDKFDDHLPLNRQAEMWNRMGVGLSRSTLSSWVLKMGSSLLPLITHLQNHLCQGNYIKADETPLQVLKTPNKSNASNSYMWVLVSELAVKLETTKDEVYLKMLKKAEKSGTID